MNLKFKKCFCHWHVKGKHYDNISDLIGLFVFFPASQKCSVPEIKWDQISLFLLYFIKKTG